MTAAAPGAAQTFRWRRRSVLPGFGLSLGYTVAYLSLIVLIPLAGLAISSASLGWTEFWSIATNERVLLALRLSFGAAMIAAIVNTFFGVLVAWVLVRYRFPGRRWLDAAVDLPFALPTAVAGIALATLYAPNGPFGAILDDWFNVKVGFTPTGVVMALIFVGLPFVVRTVQPVLEEIERETEEVSATLGAGRWRTVTRVIMPGLVPAILTGFALSFARGVGEYGSVIFIAGNLPFKSEIAPLLIVIRLEEHNYAGATAIAAIMLIISFAMLLVINLLQSWSRRWFGHV
jgi:sulfate/thiosulfate transport system permease protein